MTDRDLNAITEPAVLRAELQMVREHYDTVRLHSGIDYVTPRTSTPAAAPRSVKPAATAWPEPANNALNTTD